MDASLRAWNALTHVRGLGPKRLARVARALADSHRGADQLIGATVDHLIGVGLDLRLAEAAASALRDPPAPPAPPEGVKVLCPDHEAYPLAKMLGPVPLPALLYANGNPSLLHSSGIGIAGSRDPAEEALSYAEELARAAAKAGLNVVAGHAIGVDLTAHLAAIEAGGTTTVVLAEGIARAKLQAQIRAAEPDSVLVLSQFEPDARWSAYNAMARNETIAALSNAVVVVAAGLKGGSMAQGELCLKAGLPLYVPDLPAEVAPGNRHLIERGATRLPPGDPGAAVESLIAEPGSEQMRLLG